MSNSNLESDFSFLNCIMYNENSSKDIKAEYSEQLDQNVLSHMEDYMLSVVKMKIPTSAVGLFLFKDNTYRIGFALGNMGSHTNVIEEVITYDVPANDKQSAPENRVVTSYDQFLKCINNALRSAWTDAIGDPAYATAFDQTAYNNIETFPQFILSDKNEFLELILPCTPTNTAPNGATPFLSEANLNGVSILMNSELYYFFEGFSSQQLYNPVGNFNRVLIIEPSNLNSKIVRAFGDTPIQNVNIIPSEYGCLSTWQSLHRILLLSSMPIQNEQILIKDRQDHNKPSKSVSMSILTDIDIPASQLNLKENVFYYPNSATKRYINFRGQGILRSIDIKIMWQGKDESIYPLFIAPHHECVIKIELKRRKDKKLLQYTDDTNRFIKYH